ncbi:hypothetical protein Droror1_Dr00023507 [Drosera rotundifolia]
MSSPLGTRLDPLSGFSPAPQTMQNVSPMPQPSMQSFQRSFMPGIQPLGQMGSLNLQNHPPHSSPFQYNNSGTAQNVSPILPSTSQASAPMVSGTTSSASPNIPSPLYGPPFSPQVRSSSGLPVPNLMVQQYGMQNSGFSAIWSPSFTPLNTMTGVSPRPPLPSSGDFTFQRHTIQNSNSVPCMMFCICFFFFCLFKLFLTCNHLRLIMNCCERFHGTT